MSTKNGSTKAPPAPQEPKQRPVHEIRLGRIRAAIWANQNDNGTWYNVTLSRSYKEGEEWRSSASFARDELLTLAKVADLANSWIHHQSQATSTKRRRQRGGDPVLTEKPSGMPARGNVFCKVAASHFANDLLTH